MSLGTNFFILIGETVPKPVPTFVIEAFEKVEITHSEYQKSGFQAVFKIGRSQKTDLKDYQIVNNPLFTVFNRIIILVSIGASQTVLFDGVITNQELSSSLELGQSTFTITGLDISLMMDLEERSVSHVAQDELMIAQLIIAKYAKYGLILKVIAPPTQDRPTMNERTPVQLVTDLEYLQAMAERFAYVFNVTPGPTVGVNTAYWGPPKRTSTPQKALTVNMGSSSNVLSISFQYDALAATAIDGSIQDRKTNQQYSVQERESDRPSLAKKSALHVKKSVSQSQSHTRIKQFRESGRNSIQAASKAQAIADRSVDDIVTVTGELDSVRYGGILYVGGVVGLRGSGYSYDGLYYVKEITHIFTKGNYKQAFKLARNGLGSTVQKVIV